VMLRKKRFSRFLMVIVVLLSSISIIILSSVLYFYFSHRLEREFNQKMSSQRGEIRLLLKSRMDGLNGRLRELSLNNTIRITMMLGVTAQLGEQMNKLYPNSEGACFFIRDDHTGTTYHQRHNACTSNKMIETLLSSYPRGTFIEDKGRKKFLYLFSAPIMRRTERMGTAFCLYDMLEDRKFIETINRTVDGDVFIIAKNEYRHSIGGKIFPDKPGMYVRSGLADFTNLGYIYSLESLKKQKRGFLFLIGGVSMLLLVLSLLISVILIRKITMYLNDMTGRAVRISKGSRDVIFNEDESDYTEFNQLSGAFNYMLKYLRESEEKSRYKELFENVADSVFTVDLKGNILEANEECLRILGYDKDTLIGMNLSLIMPESDVATIINLSHKKRIEALDMCLIAADERTIPIEVNAKVIISLGKDAMLCVARDITSRKRAKEEINSYQEHLELINKILRHDVTNDLVVIRSAISLYKDSPEEELLKEISSHAEKSLELISSMRELEFFIFLHKELKLCEMKGVIIEVIKSYSSVDFEITGEARVMADDSLASVIDNIVGNAIVHGKADRITIHIGKKSDMCEVQIADNGKGIPDEIKEKIFEEGFAYGDTAHTGLGLHIVEKAMATYGGYACVEDNKPRGAVFVLGFRKVK